MENLKTTGKWTLTLMTVMALMVACGKKDGGGGGTTSEVNLCANVVNGQTIASGYVCQNGAAVNPCVNIPNGQMASNGRMCQGGIPVVTGAVGGAGILNNVQFSSSYIQGTMNIGALNAANMDMNNPYIYAYYSGPMSVVGTIQVLQQLCSAPPGNYTIVNNGQAGMFQMGLIYNLNLSANGPASIQLINNWGSSQVYNSQGLSRDASNNRIGLNAMLIVNGQSCGSISTY